MESLPIVVPILFGLCVAFTFAALAIATRLRPLPLLLMLGWIALQSVLAANGFFADVQAMPPRFIFAVAPPLLTVVLLFSLPGGRRWLGTLDPKALTWLHVVRVPVEIVLFLLATHALMPWHVTFEGRNFDIVSGLSAPLVAWFGLHRPRLSRAWMLAWHFACLALLVNVVAHAVMGLPYPFQVLSFEQPTTAVLHAPFNLLPAFVVPAVLLAHLVEIRRLLRG